MALALSGTARFLASLRNDSGGRNMALALPGIISQFSKRNIIGDQVAGLQGEFLDSLFPDGYIKIIKYELQSTEYFDKLLAKVRDATAKKRLLAATSRARHKILPRPE